MTGKALHTPYFFLKRSLDLLFSVVVIVSILSWLLPLLALIIKTDSPGPALFRQKRVGKRGRIFTCYKLRTMEAGGRADLSYATEKHRHITRAGKWLRKSNLDELPQFFNVLNGSMSLVGPRPYMVDDYRRFSELSPVHAFRELVKPGITGLAQVRGLHGSVADAKTITRRYAWDAVYVRNASFRLDIRILRQTTLLFITQQMPLCK